MLSITSAKLNGADAEDEIGALSVETLPQLMMLLAVTHCCNYSLLLINFYHFSSCANNHWRKTTLDIVISIEASTTEKQY